MSTDLENLEARLAHLEARPKSEATDAEIQQLRAELDALEAGVMEDWMRDRDKDLGRALVSLDDA